MSSRIEVVDEALVASAPTPLSSTATSSSLNKIPVRTLTAKPVISDPTASEPTRHILTKAMIQKECVKHGFYRTPSCNEKLYLHHKSYEGIEPHALVEYTDVKVLWLESNCFASLNCGSEFQHCAPPTAATPADSVVVASVESQTNATNEEEAKETKTEEKLSTATDAADTDSTSTNPVPPTAAALEAAGLEAQRESDDGKDDEPTSPSDAVAAAPNNEAAPPVVVPAELDVFSSQYPTLRQLFLHGNMFMQMPDLWKFQRLDTLNLSDNFIGAVRVGCPQWKAATTERAATRENTAVGEGTTPLTATSAEASTAASSPSKSAAATSSAVVVVPPKSETPKPLSSDAADEAKKQRETRLATMRAMVEFWSTSTCKHEACMEPLNEEAPGSRCLCGTLSTLYLKNNHLNSATALAELLCLKRLSVLDLSNNRLEDGEEVLLVLSQMSQLRALYLAGNPLVRSLPNYRKVVLSRLPKLMHLDDRPVFEDERRLVTAWAKEGLEGEKKERKKMREEEEEKQRRRLAEFRAMMTAARNGRDPYGTSTEDDTDSNPTPDTSAGEEEEDGNSITTTNNSRRHPAAQPPAARPRQLSSNQRTSGSGAGAVNRGTVHADPMAAVSASGEQSSPSNRIVDEDVVDVLNGEEQDSTARNSNSLLFSGNNRRPASGSSSNKNSQREGTGSSSTFYELNYGAEIRQREEEKQKASGTASATPPAAAAAAAAPSPPRLPVMDKDDEDDLWVPS